MQVTFETRAVAWIAAYEDDLGYLRCIECATPDTRRHALPANSLPAGSRCDDCGRDWAECGREPVMALVPVEHTPCRIF